MVEKLAPTDNTTLDEFLGISVKKIVTPLYLQPFEGFPKIGKEIILSQECLDDFLKDCDGKISY